MWTQNWTIAVFYTHVHEYFVNLINFLKEMFTYFLQDEL
jgi:hypothetical protein